MALPSHSGCRVDIVKLVARLTPAPLWPREVRPALPGTAPWLLPGSLTCVSSNYSPLWHKHYFPDILLLPALWSLLLPITCRTRVLDLCWRPSASGPGPGLSSCVSLGPLQRCFCKSTLCPLEPKLSSVGAGDRPGPARLYSGKFCFFLK